MEDDGDASFSGRSDRSGESSGLSSQDRHGEASRQRQQIEQGLFGVLYTISKEKSEQGSFWSFVRTLVDFAQLLAFIVSPAYDWDLNFNNWLFKALEAVHFQNPLQAQGYDVYVAFVYVLEFMLAACLIICGYVAIGFHRSSFRWIWPIKILKLCVSVFFSTLYVSSFNAFLQMLTCVSPERLPASDFAGVDQGDTRFRVKAFPDHVCFALPHVVHLVTALVCLVVFTAVALVLIVGEVEQSPLTANAAAQRNVLVEVRAFCLKTLLALASAILAAYKKTLGVVVLVTCAFVCYNQITWLPYHWAAQNVLVSALYSSLTFCSIMLCVINLNDTDSASHIEVRRAATTALFAGFFPTMLLGALLSMAYLRYHYAVWRKFYTLKGEATAGVRRRKYRLNELQNVHAFASPNHVELAANNWKYYRGARHELSPSLAPEVMDAVDRIYKVGMAAFPASAALRLSRSTFLIEGKRSMVFGMRENAAAMKLRPTFAQRFCVFTREQQQRQAAHQESTGEAVSDMVSYVEFKRNYDLVLRMHRKALRMERSFWRCLLRRRIDVDKLATTFERVEAHRLKARDMYKALLQQHTGSVQLMRAYAHFLETVMHDLGKAAAYLEAADDLEHQQAESRQRSLAANYGGVDPAGLAANEQHQAAVYVTVKGVIKSMNQKMEKELGVAHGELVGHNITELVPKPYSLFHQDWMDRHSEAFGDADFLDLRTVPALHRNGHAVMGKLTVFDAVGALDEEDNWVALFDPVADDDAASGAKAFVVVDDRGVVQTACLGLERASICSPSEAGGLPLWRHASDSEDMQRSLKSEMESVKHGSPPSTLMLNFQNSMGQMTVMSVTMKHRVFGDADYFELTMTEVKVTQPLLVVSATGHVIFASEPAAELLGYKVQALVKQSISQLMPSGLAARHARSWFSAAAKHRAGMPPCLGGCVAELRARDGEKVHCRLSVQLSGSGVMRKYVLEFEPCAAADYKQQHCATLLVSPQTLAVKAAVANCFGLPLDGMDLRMTCDLMVAAQTLEQGQELVCAMVEQRVRLPARVMMYSPNADDAASTCRLTAVVRRSRMHLAALMTAGAGAAGEVAVDFWALEKLRGFLSISIDGNYNILLADRHAALLLGHCEPLQLRGRDLRCLTRGELPRLLGLGHGRDAASELKRAFEVVTRSLTLPLAVIITPVELSGKGLSVELRAARDPMIETTPPEALLRTMAARLAPESFQRLVAAGFGCLGGLQSGQEGETRVEPGTGSVLSVDGSWPAIDLCAPLVSAQAPASNEIGNDGRGDGQLQDSQATEDATDGPVQGSVHSAADCSVSTDSGAAADAPAAHCSVLERNEQPPTEYSNPLFDDGHQPAASQQAAPPNALQAAAAIDTWLSWSTDQPADPTGMQEVKVLEGLKRHPNQNWALYNQCSSGVEDVDAAALSDAEMLQMQKPGSHRHRLVQISALLAKLKVYQAGVKMAWTVALASCATLAVLVGGFCALMILTSVTRGDVHAILDFERVLVSEARMMAEMRLVVWGSHSIRLQVEDELKAQYEEVHNATAPSDLPMNDTLLFTRLYNDSYLQAHATHLRNQVPIFRASHKAIYDISQNSVLGNSLQRQFFEADIEPVPSTLQAAVQEGVVPLSVLQSQYSNMSTWSTLRRTRYSLWEAGNELASLCEILSTHYGFYEYENPYGIQQTTEMQIILHVGPELFPAHYVDLMGLYVRDNEKNAKTVFSLSMSIMAIEIACCLLACVAVCLQLRVLSTRRIALFSVFLRVPKAVLKALATQKVDVEAIGGTEEGAIHQVVEMIQVDDSSDSDDSGRESSGGSTGTARIGSMLQTGSFRADGSARGRASSQGVAESAKVNREDGSMILAAPSDRDVLNPGGSDLEKHLWNRSRSVQFARRGSAAVKGETVVAAAAAGLDGSVRAQGSLDGRASKVSSAPDHGAPGHSSDREHSGGGKQALSRMVSAVRATARLGLLPSARRAMRQQRWAVLRGGWVFYVVLALLIAITSTVSSNISTVGVKMYSISLFSYLSSTVYQVRSTAISMTHAQSYTRRYKLRNILLAKLQQMRLLMGVLYSGKAVDSLLPPDLHLLYNNSTLRDDHVSLQGERFSADEDVALLTRAPPDGCWRVDRASCVPQGDLLYAETSLPAADLIGRLWLETLQLVTDSDAQLLQHAAALGLPLPSYADDALPEALLAALDSGDQSAREAVLQQYTLDMVATDSYHLVDEVVDLDLGAALTYVTDVRLQEVLNVCVTTVVAHCCGMVLTLLLVAYYVRRTTTRVTGPAKTVALRVAEVLSLMPKHVRVIDIINAVLERDKKLRHESRLRRSNRVEPSSRVSGVGSEFLTRDDSRDAFDTSILPE